LGEAQTDVALHEAGQERTVAEQHEKQQGNPPLIRRATRKDLPHIGRLGALLVEVHHAFDSRRFLPATSRTKDAYAAYLGSQLDAPGAAVFVAEENGDVIGYAYVAAESYDYMALRGPAGVLHDIIVDPERRRSGVGKRLLEAALGFVLERGLNQLVLATAERNEAAQKFFASVGFRPTMIEMTRDL
jgi:ribosomal protein S18 acetylase RimI-like enzyme